MPLVLQLGIRRLPEEILCLIFTEVCGSEDITSLHARDPLIRAVRLSHVCRHFRAVALSLRSLWTVLSPQHPEEMISMALERSRGASLKILTRTGPNTSTTHISRFVDTVVSHAHRWTHLNFDLLDKDLLVARTIQSKYPCLSLPKLTHISDYTMFRPEAPSWSHFNLPMLRSVTGIEIGSVLNCVNAITDLDLTIKFIHPLHELLPHLATLPALRNLHMCFDGECDSHLATNPPFWANMPTYHNKERENFLSLTSLSLMFVDCHEADMPILLFWLRELIPVTRLRTLRMIFHTQVVNVTESLLDEHSIFPNLKELTFGCTDPRVGIMLYEPLINWLHCMPSLSDASFYRTRILDDRQSLEWCLAEDLDFWSQLETLTYQGCMLNTSLLEAIAEDWGGDDPSLRNKKLRILGCPGIEEFRLRQLEQTLKGKIEWTLPCKAQIRQHRCFFLLPISLESNQAHY